MAVPAEAYRLTSISSKAYEHPADRAATAALGSIPMLDLVVRKLIEMGYERALRQTYLGSSVRLGPDQLPRIWSAYHRALTALDMPEEYDLYITQQPLANAATIGAGKPIIILNSATVTLLDDRGIEAVLGHELGHILSEHVLYRTVLMVLLRLGSSVRLPIPGGHLPLLAVRYALLEWSRAAELSCDRAAALTTNDPRVVCSMLMAMSGGAAADELNLEAFERQAMEYTEGGAGLDRLQRMFSDLNLDHGMPVKRVHELMAWVRSGDYDRVVGGEYPRRDDAPKPPSAEASDAAAHYSDVFRNIFREAGDQVSSAGQQVSGWLRSKQEASAAAKQARADGEQTTGTGEGEEPASADEK
ncbi:MAG: M48 family metallopeptidase [Solirubrobacteraceae bacterium]